MKKAIAGTLPYLVLAALIFFVFWPCLFAGFLNWDDVPYLLNNPLFPLHGFRDMGALFMSADVSNGIYIPLTFLSFGIEQAVWGWSPFVFHFDNIFLHVMASGLVLLLGQRLGLSVKAAFVAALVFAIHPMRVESVAWVIERKDVLFGVFYLGALVLYLDYLRSDRMGHYFAALVCAILSMLSKPMAVSLPLVLFLLDWMSDRRWSLRSLWDKAPFMLALWPMAMISTVLVPGKLVWQSWELCLITAYASVFYVVEFFCPQGLQMVIITPRPVVWFHPAYLGALGGLLAFGVAAWFFRKNRWVVFAGGFYVSTIFIVLQVAKYTGIIVGERYMYIPCVGFVLLAGAAWDQIFFREGLKSSRRAWLGWVVAAFLCTALATTTFERCWAWQDSFTFWTEVLRGNPGDANAHNNRGTALVNDPHVRRKYGLAKPLRYELARRDFKRATELAPRDPDAWHNLSVMLDFFGRKEEAEKAALKAKQLGWYAP